MVMMVGGTPPEFPGESGLGTVLFRLCLAVPWERWLFQPARSPRPAYHGEKIMVGTPKSLPPPQSPKPDPSVESQEHRPGCTVADETGVALFYLEGLARGNGGFGVLRLGQEHLDKAAMVAQDLGKGQLADQIREVAQELPHIHDEESARQAAEKLRPIADKCWMLGRVCGLAHNH